MGKNWSSKVPKTEDVDEEDQEEEVTEELRKQRCSNCGKKVYIDDNHLNKSNIRLSTCPECGHTLTVTGN